MTSLLELLDAYDDVILRYRSVMEKELASLQSEGALDESLVEAKQAIVKELDIRLRELRAARESSAYVDPELKGRFDQVQHTFMQVIKLDREVEKAYLNRGSGGEGLADRRGGRDWAAARRHYGMPHGGDR